MSVKRIRKEKKRILVQVDEILKSMKEYGKWWLELEKRVSDVEDDIYQVKTDFTMDRDLGLINEINVLRKARRKDIAKYKELESTCLILFIIVCAEAIVIAFLSGYIF
ncbi:hypothetical protein B5E58_11090 [Tyzzerella sp. An114]|uniref:hypothetical protein n=1 Tax=Tyzzerella sp. An114 TaxID=1965545 RepID=UPI000B454B6B|nr:hypothetical protein [Tyzzerella sp. An114]OUQ56212.1 hypothetical protein B5E58_11090 [Tyzzerella sp. An114]